MYLSSFVIYIVDTVIRGDPVALNYQVYAAAYLTMVLGSLVSQWALLSTAGRMLHARLKSGKGLQYLGTALHLTVPFRTWLVYVSFWLLVGGVKMAFAYWGLAVPLVVPLTAVWQNSFDGKGSMRNYENFGSNGAHLVERCRVLEAA